MSDLPFQYDPTQDPRSLYEPPNHEVILDWHAQVAEVQNELLELNRLRSMMGTEAWKKLIEEVDQELQTAVNALIVPQRVNTLEQLAFIQGQVQILMWLKQLPEVMKGRQEMARLEKQRLETNAPEPS